ncbi:MAG TPA: hypothetical protein VH020_14455 [Stellaceae bacterium]|jgi:hypothetical protein|nr:hypothetical protein [Stellaceae bacterium]
MAEVDPALGALAALEQRYDGPIPEPLKRIAIHGSAARRSFIEAASQAQFFSAMIRGQLEAIRRSRHGGAIPAGLYADLALYRRRRHWWRRETARLSAADAP